MRLAGERGETGQRRTVNTSFEIERGVARVKSGIDA